MKKINRFLIFFLLLLSVLSLVAWELLRSKYFAEFASSQISKYASTDVVSAIKFEKAKVKFFPPGISLVGVELAGMWAEQGSVGGSIQLDEIDLRLDLLKILSNKVSFSEIVISGGSLQLLFKAGEQQKKKEQAQRSSWSKHIGGLLSKIYPHVGKLVLTDIAVNSNVSDFYIKRQEIEFFSRSMHLVSKLYSLKLFGQAGHLFKNSEAVVDEVFARVKMLPDTMVVEQLQLRARDSLALFSGEIKNYLAEVKNFEYSGELSVKSLRGERMKDFFPDTKIYGNIDAHFKLSGKGRDFSGQGSLDVKDFKTANFNIAQGRVEFAKIKQDIVVNSVKIRIKGGELRVGHSFKLFNLAQNTFYPVDIFGEMKSFHIDRFLLLREFSLDGFEVLLAGEFNFFIDDKKIKFSSDRLFASRLRYSYQGLQIVNSKNARLANVELIADLGGNDAVFKAGILMKKTAGKIVGRIGRELNIKADFKRLDLVEILAMEELNFKGIGKGSLLVTGPLDDILFRINLQTKNSGLLGYRFGAIDSKIDLFLSDSFLQIKKSKVYQGKSSYSVEGVIDYSKKTHIDLSVVSKRGTYRVLKDMIFPISSQVKVLPRDISGFFAGYFKILGYVDDLQVVGAYSGAQLDFWGEGVARLKLKFLYENNILQISDIVADKEQGVIQGSYSYDIAKDKHQYDFLVKDIKVYDFETINPNIFGLNGDIYISGNGQFSPSNIEGKINFSLNNSSVVRVNVPASSGQIRFGKKGMEGALSIFGDDIVFRGKLFWDSTSERSVISVDVDTKRVRESLGIFFPHNIERADISGSIRARAKSSFFTNDFKHLNAAVDIEQFNYFSDRMQLAKNDEGSSLLVANGRVMRNQLLLQGKDPGSYLGVMAIESKNNEREGVMFSLSGEIDADIARVFDENILRSDGDIEIKANLKTFGNIEDTEVSFLLNGDKINALYAGIPADFEDLNFSMVLDSNRIFLKKFSGKLGGGKLDMEGHILLDVPFPVFNLKYDLKNSKINLLQKTNVWISSWGKIIGDSVPYMIKGETVLINGNILDSFKNFAKITGKKYTNPYVPASKSSEKFGVFHIDSSLTTINPIYIKNDFSKMNAHVKLNIAGSMLFPDIKGWVKLVPGTGKFYFKNSDFLLTKGSVEFGREGREHPFFDFLGSSTVQRYTVMLKVWGYLDDFSIKLSSEPNLSEKSILSLLATGVTAEETSRLSESDQESVASLGIGALILDRFKFNQGLQSGLGVNVGLTSEVVEGERNYLREDKQVEAKNTTKVSVEKKVTDNVSIRASSTLGTDTSQRQKMNINYNINKNLSLEGVYELRGSEDGQGESSDSLGTDIKFRVEF